MRGSVAAARGRCLVWNCSENDALPSAAPGGCRGRLPLAALTVAVLTDSARRVTAVAAAVGSLSLR